MSNPKNTPYTLQVFNASGAMIDSFLCVDNGDQTEATLLADYIRRFPNAGAVSVQIVERPAV